MYSVTIVVQNSYDADSAVISDAVSRVYYVDNGVEHDITPVDGVYEVPEGIHPTTARPGQTKINVVYAKAGFQGATDSNIAIYSDPQTITKRLIPDYTCRFGWQYINPNTGAAANITRFDLALQEKSGDQWTTVETETNMKTGYLTSALTAGKTYKVVATSSVYRQRETDEFTEFPVDNYMTIPVTYGKYISLFQFLCTDHDTQEPLEGVQETIQYQSKTKTVPTYGDATTLLYNETLDGYLVNQQNGSTDVKLTCTFEKEAYRTYVLEEEHLSSAGRLSEVETRDIDMIMDKLYTDLVITVADQRHGTEITDADITVVDRATGDELEPISAGLYSIVYNCSKTYDITISKDDYVTYTGSVTPEGAEAILLNVQLEKTLRYTSLYVEPESEKGEPLTDATITVYDLYEEQAVEKTDDHWEVIYNDNESYRITVTYPGYYEYVSQPLYPQSSQEITLTPVLEKIPVYADLYVTVTDDYTHTPVMDAEISVYDLTAESYVEPSGIIWELLAEEDHEYRVEISAPGYYDYESETFEAPDNTAIYKDCEIEAEPLYAPLTVVVKDQDTGETITDGIVTVENLTTGELVDCDEHGIFWLHIDALVDQTYKASVTKRGYTYDATEPFTVIDTYPITKVLMIEATLEPFATPEDLKARTGINYSKADLDRIDVLLTDVSNLIRSEGRKCGVDVDDLIGHDRVYKGVVRTVTCDVTQRIMRQSQEGDAMSQESQSALGYSWSGTYAIPGGGIAMSLMRNEKEILGFNPQTIGVIDLC